MTPTEKTDLLADVQTVSDLYAVFTTIQKEDEWFDRESGLTVHEVATKCTMAGADLAPIDIVPDLFGLREAVGRAIEWATIKAVTEVFRPRAFYNGMGRNPSLN